MDDLDQTERMHVVPATLPACPGCGVKDRARVRGGTTRPYGREHAAKCQYVECQVCGESYRIDWE